MDELTLDDKKYVSTKMAAKMTGYAKDYVGQLCREGRIPARMVGRSWYVLESAIQDHRFGAPPEPSAPSNAPSNSPFSTWAAPRYEATKTEPLPSINRLESVAQNHETKPEQPRIEDPQELARSWSSWFSTAQSPDAAELELPAAPQMQPELPAADEPAAEQDDEEVPVPIHTVYAPEYQPAIAEPVRAPVQPHVPETKPVEAPTIRTRRGSYAPLRVALIALALISVSIAAVGTGYAAAYTSSLKPAQLIAGISEYQK